MTIKKAMENAVLALENIKPCLSQSTQVEFARVRDDLVRALGDLDNTFKLIRGIEDLAVVAGEKVAEIPVASQARGV